MPLDLETRLGLVKLYYNNKESSCNNESKQKDKSHAKKSISFIYSDTIDKKIQEHKNTPLFTIKRQPSLEENRVGAVVEHKFACILTHPVYIYVCVYIYIYIYIYI